MSHSNSPADKIHDEELRAFAADKAAGQRTVFITLDLPTRHVDFRTVPTGDGPHQVPTRVRPPTEAEQEEMRAGSPRLARFSLKS